MSDPACLLYDISNLKARDMDCMDIAKTEDGLEPQVNLFRLISFINLLLSDIENTAVYR